MNEDMCCYKSALTAPKRKNEITDDSVRSETSPNLQL